MHRNWHPDIQPTTRTRVDLGLRLEAVEPGGRLEPPRGIGQSSMTHRISLSTPEDVDAEVLDWLGRAYTSNL